jgi:hypothetical protein
LAACPAEVREALLFFLAQRRRGLPAAGIVFAACYFFSRRKAEGTLHPFLQKRTFFLSKNKKADPQRQIGFILQGHKTDPYIEVKCRAE